MKALTTITQAIRKIDTNKLTIKAGSAVVFSLMLVNVYQLAHHGQTALAAYMLMGSLLERLHHRSTGAEAAENVVHIVAHNTKGH